VYNIAHVIFSRPISQDEGEKNSKLLQFTGLLSFVSAIEELLERKVEAPV
jgi:hypothetical protein